MKPTAIVCLAAACSGSTGSGTYAAKCEADEMGCRRDCAWKTEGLAALCAQRVLDNSRWACHDLPIHPTCTAATGTCDGFVLASTSGNECSSSCLMR